VSAEEEHPVEEPISANAFAAAAQAAVIEAIKASGVVVRVYPNDFQTILGRAPGALVVHATSGLFSTTYQYLVSYKGLAFLHGVARVAVPAAGGRSDARREYLGAGVKGRGHDDD